MTGKYLRHVSLLIKREVKVLQNMRPDAYRYSLRRRLQHQEIEQSPEEKGVGVEDLSDLSLKVEKIPLYVSNNKSFRGSNPPGSR